jgi:hypothetical protein
MTAMTPKAIETAVDRWTVPPACQGQIVEVAYGVDRRDRTAYRRTTDRSGARRVQYARADLDECGCEGECDCWDPANREPGAYEWDPCAEGEYYSR